MSMNYACLNIVIYRIQTFSQWADKRKEGGSTCAASCCTPSQCRCDCVQCYEAYVKECLPFLDDATPITRRMN